MDQSNDKNSSISEEKSSISELSGTSSFLHRLQFTSIHSDKESESSSGSQLPESQLSGTTSILDGIRFSPFDSNEEITSNHSDESNHSNTYVKSVAEIILKRQASAIELVNQPAVERFDIMEANNERKSCCRVSCCRVSCCRVSCCRANFKIILWTVLFALTCVLLTVVIIYGKESEKEFNRTTAELEENFFGLRPSIPDWLPPRPG